MSGWREWRLRLAVMVTILLLGGLAACQASEPRTPATSAAEGPRLLPTVGPVPEVSGRLVLARDREFLLFDPSTAEIESLARFPDGSLAGTPSTSPDGKQIAFSLFQTGEAGGGGGSDLYLMAADGSGQRPLLEDDVPGAALNAPTWAPDGQSVYFTYYPPQEMPRIERVRLDGSGRELVIEDGFSPTISGDGEWLAFLRRDAASAAPSLWLARSDGSEARELVGLSSFTTIASPRFAPRGEQIAFVAVDSTTSRAPAAPLSLDPVGWLRARPARAHGVPYDLWLVGIDGEGLRRVADLDEDGPIPAWSLDGKWIALAGELGLYLIDAEGQSVRHLVEEAAWGGISWLPD